MEVYIHVKRGFHFTDTNRNKNRSTADSVGPNTKLNVNPFIGFGDESDVQTRRNRDDWFIHCALRANNA